MGLREKRQIALAVVERARGVACLREGKISLDDGAHGLFAALGRGVLLPLNHQRVELALGLMAVLLAPGQLDLLTAKLNHPPVVVLAIPGTWASWPETLRSSCGTEVRAGRSGW